MSRLDAYSDNQRPPPRETCECGKWRNRWAAACRRCLFLDGADPLVQKTIEALRVSDGLTVRELCTAVGRDYMRYRAGMLRCLRSLEESGRVGKFWAETDPAAESMRRSRYGGMVRAVGSNSGCWRYTLDCKQRRAA